MIPASRLSRRPFGSSRVALCTGCLPAYSNAAAMISLSRQVGSILLHVGSLTLLLPLVYDRGSRIDML